MADAVAVLGIAVESTEAERDLRNFEAIARRSGKSVEEVAARFKKMREEAKGLPAPLKDASNEAARQADQFQQMAAGSKAADTAIKFLSNTIGGMVSSMVTGGIAGITAAITTYALEALGAVRNLDEKIKAHAELVRSLKDAYGEAGKGIDTAAKESQNVLRALLAISTDKLQQDFERLAKSAAAPGQQMAQFVDDFGRIIDAGTDKFAPFRKAIDDFNASVRAGKPDVQTFRESVASIINGGLSEEGRKAGDELLTASKNAGSLASNLDASKRAITDLAEAAKAISDKNFADGLKTLSGTVTKSLTDRERIEKNYQDLMKNANTDAKQMTAMAERDNQLAILSYNGRKKAAEEAAKAQESAAKRFAGTLDQTSKRNASIEGRIAGIGKGAGELARLETQYRLTEAAEQAFGTVSEDTAAKIAKTANAAGEAAQKLAQARVTSNIKFEGRTSFLSQEDVSIAQRLRALYGDDVPKALASSEAAAMHVNDAMKGISSAIENNLTTGLADIVDGTKSVAQGFADLGKSILRMLTEAAIKAAIVAPLLRTVFGGATGGGLLSFLGIGGASSALGPITLGGPAGPVPFADGGYTGPGSRLQPAGIVHAGEFVFSQAATNRIGVGPLNAMHQNALRGYDSGGLVSPYVEPMNVIPFRSPANSNYGGAPNISFGDTNLTIHGDVGPNEVDEIKQVLAEHRMEQKRMAMEIAAQGKVMAAGFREAPNVAVKAVAEHMKRAG